MDYKLSSNFEYNLNATVYINGPQLLDQAKESNDINFLDSIIQNLDYNDLINETKYPCTQKRILKIKKFLNSKLCLTLTTMFEKVEHLLRKGNFFINVYRHDNLSNPYLRIHQKNCQSRKFKKLYYSDYYNCNNYKTFLSNDVVISCDLKKTVLNIPYVREILSVILYNVPYLLSEELSQSLRNMNLTPKEKSNSEAERIIFRNLRYNIKCDEKTLLGILHDVSRLIPRCAEIYTPVKLPDQVKMKFITAIERSDN